MSDSEKREAPDSEAPDSEAPDSEALDSEAPNSANEKKQKKNVKGGDGPSSAGRSADPQAEVEWEAPRSKKKGKKKHAETAVRLRSVTKKFGDRYAVDGITLRIAGGSVYGLIGPNGAGKTTTFSMLAGYLNPTAGSVEVLGFSPNDVVALRGRLGVLPQDALLPASDKVGEFLMHMAQLQGMTKGEAETSARETLDEVDGKDWWNLKCGALSHGMAKRVGIAQALLGEPDVVLLDEPTAGLDPRIAYEVRQLIKGRKGRTTLIISSHNLQELEEICDGAAVLDHGKLVASGSISELTAAAEEIHVKIIPKGKVDGGLPMKALRDLQDVKRVEYHDETQELVVYFERSTTQAESVIGAVLWVLVQERTLISGVTKGRSLERRVMDLTDR